MQKDLPEVSRIKFAIQSYAPPGEALRACNSGKRKGPEAAALDHARAKHTAPGCSAEVCRKQLLPVTAGQYHDPSPPGHPRARHGRLPDWAELTEPHPVCRSKVTEAPASDAQPYLSQQVLAPTRHSRCWGRGKAGGGGEQQLHRFHLTQ